MPTAGDAFAIGAECHGVDFLLVSLQREHLGPGFDVPYLDFTADSELTTTTDEVFAVSG